MITRGYIIGKIVDDLATLKYQIELRNKIGLFDLTKFCEDFFKDLLNLTYKTNLRNLNSLRSNEPGIDLGDTAAKTAYQITSQKTTSKINATLSALRDEQISEFEIIKVFIIGDRQKKYSVNAALKKRSKFKESNIIDINSLTRDIVLLSMDDLDAIYRLFQKEFRLVRIELEPVDSDGNFESSYYNTIEKKPSAPPKNAEKFLDDYLDDSLEKDFAKLNSIYKELSRIPRVTREILSIIVERGVFEEDIFNGAKYKIQPLVLERFLRLNNREFWNEINILEEANLVWVTEDFINDRPAIMIYINSSVLNFLFIWLQEKGISLRLVLNEMDFQILDK